MSTSPIIVSGEFAGRYTVERVLGRGATSVVYLARDLDYGRMVAIKVLRDELATSVAADRFLREIRVTAQLHHPHILPVLHSGEDTGRLFFVLPFMDGGTLRDRLEREKQLPIAEVVAIGLTIANALASAHEKNLLHRDVKPENILFTGGQACLADFGIARAITRSVDDSTTTQGFVRGTPAYMSPEQASGEQEYDGRSDLYSLACVLYEALAGIQPFVGPTPQAVIAQRLVHPPRPVRVYRPSASAELEAMLARALQAAPADRYQSAQEFAEALGAVPIASTREQRGAPRARRWTRSHSSVTVVVFLTVAAWLSRDRLMSSRSGLSADTSRVAVLPFDSSANVTAELLVNGLQRWRGFTIVEDFAVSDAIRRRGHVATDADARAVARAVNAGRYVRGRVIESASWRGVEAVLYDVSKDTALYRARLPITNDSSELFATFARLADSLVLRGRHDVRRAPDNERNFDVGAVQLFLSAQSALTNWNLARAESLFSVAVDRDAGYGRAHLWLAQVRAWRTPSGRPDPTSWRGSAERAALDSAALPVNERAMAIALRELSTGQYSSACSSYRRIIRADSASFIGWFGLAQCHDFDRTVIPDATTASRWRFRSSYQQAITAYARAFEVLPSAYRGFGGAAFALVRQKLFTSLRFIRTGYREDDASIVFQARPAVSGDSIAFIPWPGGLGAVARPADEIKRSHDAVYKMRTLFMNIALSWVARLPSEPEAREALAVALEVLGDPAAADSFASAARLAVDSTQRARLAVAAITMRVKLAIPDRLDQLEIARREADSLIRVLSPTTPERAELVARLAAIVGRCDVAAVAAPRVIEPIKTQRIPDWAVSETQTRLAYTALGCTAPRDVPSLADIARRLVASQPTDAARRLAPSLVLPSLVRAEFPPDTLWAKQMVTNAPSLLGAELAWARGDRAKATALLDTLTRNRRAAMPGDLTADVALIEAKLRLALGDSAGARRALDQTLESARYYTPMSVYETTQNMVIVASLVRAAGLRAWLGPQTEAPRWRSVVMTLWKDGGESLQSALHR